MKKSLACRIVIAMLVGSSAVIGCSLDSETPQIDNLILGAIAENTPSLCTDGLDNNHDGFIDCNDIGCQKHVCTDAELGDCRTKNPNSTDADCESQYNCSILPATCNGCDCSKDYNEIQRDEAFRTNCSAICLLPECQRQLPGNTVCPGTRDLTTGVWTMIENTPEACSDGIDNDGNGYADCRDNSCKTLSVCCVVSGDENTADTCSDGIDNDCDGYTDCADYSCKGGKSKDSVATQEAIDYCTSLEFPYGKVITEENTLATCSDGIDNDGNGYIDCADYSCSRSGDEEAIAYCTIVEEDEKSEEACSDKRDNDLNGYIDCDDPSCASTAYCQNAVPEPRLTLNPGETADQLKQAQILSCTDGIDNNLNGLIDCAEYQCHILSLKYGFNCNTNSTETNP